MTTSARLLLLAFSAGLNPIAAGCGDDGGSATRTAALYSARPTSGPLCLAGTSTPPVIRIGIPESISGVDEKTTSSLPNLAAWLSTQIGLPVGFVPIRNYDEFTEGLRNGRLQAALIPPAEYIRAKRILPCLELVATTVYGTSTFYNSDLIIHRDSAIRTPAQLRGRRIAFSSPRSASGYIYAARFLAARGLMPWTDYEPVFTGSHRETIAAVQSKTVDAGSTFTDALRLAGEGGADLADISILAVTGQIPSEPLVISPDVTPDLSRRITNAFMGINRGNHDEPSLLGPNDLISGWVETNEAAYASIEEILTEVEALDESGGGE